jgi:hypothetical protein
LSVSVAFIGNTLLGGEALSTAELESYGNAFASLIPGGQGSTDPPSGLARASLWRSYSRLTLVFVGTLD